MKPEDFRADAKRPLTGEEYLKSLQDGREIYIYGERVKDVTTHPAFRNAAASIASFRHTACFPGVPAGCFGRNRPHKETANRNKCFRSVLQRTRWPGKLFPAILLASFAHGTGT